MSTGGLVEVACAVCGRKFKVADVAAPVPEHLPEGEARTPGMPDVPCVGSHVQGVPVRSATEGLE